MLFFIFLLGYIFEDSDSLLVFNDSLLICGYHQYLKKVHLTNNVRLIIRTWNGSDSTGKLILQASLIHIHNAIIEGNGKGFAGGTNTHPNGYGPGCGFAGVSGGGGGGYGGAGRGIKIHSDTVIIRNSVISVRGGNGGDGAGGGGGGGGGGRIKIFYETLDTAIVTFRILGGIGGNGGYGNGEDGQSGSLYLGTPVVVEECGRISIIPRMVGINKLTLERKTNSSPLLIYDATGRRVKKIENYFYSVDISDLRTGVYFLKIDNQLIGKFIRLR